MKKYLQYERKFDITKTSYRAILVEFLKSKYDLDINYYKEQLEKTFNETCQPLNIRVDDLYKKEIELI